MTGARRAASRERVALLAAPALADLAAKGPHAVRGAALVARSRYDHAMRELTRWCASYGGPAQAMQGAWADEAEAAEAALFAALGLPRTPGGEAAGALLRAMVPAGACDLGGDRGGGAA